MRKIVASCLMAFTSASFASQGIGDGKACLMPVANFNFSYMSSLLSAAGAPDRQSFLNSLSNDIDASKMQLYLWYVYNNQDLAQDFFSRINVVPLIEEKEDAINSILWLMMRKGDFLKHMHLESIQSLLRTWKADFKKRKPQRNWLLDVYQSDRIEEERPAKPADTTIDIDVELRLGVDSERRGRLLEALFFYTEAAGAGSQQGLVGASLLLPQVGGQKCLSRAAYYALLSGATGPVQWYPRSPGSEESD